MTERITQDKIKESLSFFESMYDAVRLVDPLQKRVLECKRNGKSNLDEECISSWGEEMITDDSIAVRAYHEKKSFIKLVQRPEGTVTVAAVPLRNQDRPLILEFILDAANVQIVSAPQNCEDWKAVKDALADANGMAIQDGLTSLYNRYYFDERLPRDISEAVAKNAPLSVIFIDADDLKIINDTLGHIAGDLALKEIGAAIQRNIRLDHDWAARYGGDEFFVSLHHTPYDKAFRVAERIREEVEKITIAVPEGSIRLSASLGVHTLNGSVLTTDELISLVDQKMYHAKKNGKNRTVGNGPDVYINEAKMSSTCSLGRDFPYSSQKNTIESEGRNA